MSVAWCPDTVTVDSLGVSEIRRTPAVLVTTGGSLNVSADVRRARSSAGDEVQSVTTAATSTTVERMS
jgi:hypothetical protein